MYFTIATLRGQQGKLEVVLNKDGNKYVVGLINHDKEEFTHKTFDTRKAAKEVFFHLSEYIVDSLYSYEEKKKVLE
jgi:hypothetical protein